MCIHVPVYKCIYIWRQGIKYSGCLSKGKTKSYGCSNVLLCLDIALVTNRVRARAKDQIPAPDGVVCVSRLCGWLKNKHKQAISVKNNIIETLQTMTHKC